MGFIFYHSAKRLLDISTEEKMSFSSRTAAFPPLVVFLLHFLKFDRVQLQTAAAQNELHDAHQL